MTSIGQSPKDDEISIKTKNSTTLASLSHDTSVSTSASSVTVRATFFSLVAGMSVISGFAATLVAAKRKDEAMFDKGFLAKGMTESGSALALRALGRATVFAVGGFSIVCLGVWKLTGAESLHDLRSKLQSAVRSVTPENQRSPRGRTEFATVRELVNYILEEDSRAGTVKSNKKD